MITLVLDRQNNRIIIDNNEVPVDGNPGDPFRDVMEIPDDDELDICADDLRVFIGQGPSEKKFVATKRIEYTDVEFEGLVFRLVDKNGNSWSTEIIGAVINGE